MKNIMNQNEYLKKGCFLIFLWLLFSVVYAQESTYEGVITTSSGELIENVKITVKENPSRIVFSDVKGYFSIAAEKGQHLIFEHQNLKKKEFKIIEIAKKHSIVLDKKSKLLNTGYGKLLRNEELVSSVGSVSRDAIERITSQSIEGTLFGQLSGLRLFQNTNALPDQRTSDLNIRGQATLGDKSILILIDGVERPLNTVVPDEVESVTVLRDAAAKARYGQKGANGVLIVNTRRGSNGKIKFSGSVSQGITLPTRLPEFLDAASYALAENEARRNEGLLPRYSDIEINYFRTGQYPYLYPNVDWLHETLGEKGYFANYNFNFSGGNDISRYFVSMNYQNEDGLYKATNRNKDFSTQLKYQKFNVRTNLDIRLTPTTMAQINLAGLINLNRQPATPGAGKSVAEYVLFNIQRYRVNRQPSRDIVGASFSIPSAMFPVRNEDGSWGGTNRFGNNPIALISDAGFDLNQMRSFSNEVSIKQDLGFITKGLSVQLFGAYFNQVDYWENKTKTFAYKEVVPTLNASGEIIKTETKKLGVESDLVSERYSGNQQQSSYDFRIEVNYTRNFGRHAMQSFLLVQQEQYDFHGINQVFRSRNFVGNVHYGFDNKYFFDGTLSYSGSNRIQHKKDRFGLFPAIACGWIVSNESFIQNNTNLIDLLKIRASYGKTGNGLIEMRDLTSDKYGGGYNYYFGNNHDLNSGIREIALGINRKTFETSLEANIGIDVTLFKNLHLSGEVFHVMRKNIFVPASGKYSTVLGLLPLAVPEGIVENKGYELELSWSDRIGTLNYFLAGKFSHYKNKIINRNEDYRPHKWMKREGQSIGQRFGWESQGFFKDEADIKSYPKQLFGEIRPGDIIYTDKNRDGYVDVFDESAIGYPNFPEIYYSFSLGLNYKGIELSALFQGTERSSALLSQSHVFWPLRNDGNISTWYSNYWSENNKENATLPRLAKVSDNNFRANDIWIRDNSYLKLRYAEISYMLPPRLLLNNGFRQMKIYLRGNDLLCFDKIKYVDPENVSATYPSLISYNIGIEIKF